MSCEEKWIWKPETPASVPAGARISAGKSGSVARSLPARAVASVNLVPVSCIPSPESPVKRMATRSISLVGFAGIEPRAPGGPSPPSRFLSIVSGRRGCERPAGFGGRGSRWLKAPPHRSDDPGVFFARQDAPDPARSALRSLRPSMNRPVVVVEDLPAGPASAAIASLGGPAGSRVALAIRSERSGQVVFFGPDEELRAWHGAEQALDAALA